MLVRLNIHKFSGDCTHGWSSKIGLNQWALVSHEKSSIYSKDLRATAFDPEAAVYLILKRGENLIIHPLLIHGSGSKVIKLSPVALMVGYQKMSALFKMT
jgi:hypothetical protein